MIKWLFKYGAAIFTLNTILLSIEETYSLGNQIFLAIMSLFVVLLTLYHFYLGKILGQFKLDLNKHSHKFYRFINEIPTLLLILIIFVVIFKPI